MEGAIDGRSPAFELRPSLTPKPTLRTVPLMILPGITSSDSSTGSPISMWPRLFSRMSAWIHTSTAVTSVASGAPAAAK